MQSFKQYLEEAELTREQVVDWLIKNKNKVEVNSPREAVINEPPFKIKAHRVDFRNVKTIFKKQLPVQFESVVLYFVAEHDQYFTDLAQLRVDKVTNTLNLVKTEITSLENCPEVANLNIRNCNLLQSLHGIHKSVTGISMYGCNIPEIDVDLPNLKRLEAPVSGLTTLKNIEKHCPNLETLQINGNKIIGPILGILKLEKLTPINFIYSTNAPAIEAKNNRFVQACMIVEEFIKDGNRNISQCQTRLFQAGLKEFASI